MPMQQSQERADGRMRMYFKCREFGCIAPPHTFERAISMQAKSDDAPRAEQAQKLPEQRRKNGGGQDKHRQRGKGAGRGNGEDDSQRAAMRCDQQQRMAARKPQGKRHGQLHGSRRSNQIRRNTSVPLVPPKPKELESALRISILRAVLAH